MKLYFLLFIVCFFVISTGAQTTSVRMNNEKWNQVDAFERQSLPQSALEIVNQIREEAIQSGNSPELIKSLIYQLKYETAINQDQLPDKIVELEHWIQSDKNGIEQAMLYSIVAELYANYYYANSYSIDQRTAITDSVIDDMREWPANLFIRKIADYVRLSLLPIQELQKTDVLNYRAVVMEGESSRDLRPTLYDFLVNRGIDLLTRLIDNPRVENYFSQTQLSGKEDFAPVENFVQHIVPVNDYDFVPQVLQLYRDLLDFRLKENNPKALLIADLDRLEFVSKNTQLANADSIYLESLQQLEEQYSSNDFCVEILYKKALLMQDRVPSGFDYYDSGTSAEDSVLLKENLEQVYSICVEGIKKYPQYDRIQLLKNLLYSITGSNFALNANNVVYPGASLDINVRYRNIHKLIVQIYKINSPTVYYINWGQAGEYEKNGKLIQTKEVDLTSDYPYLFYNSVVKVPVNEPGNYEYVIYADSISSKESAVNKQFSVSRLASLTRSVDGKLEFLITDRLSGKPIEGATIQLYRRKNNSFELVDGKKFTTDPLGLAMCSANNNLFYKASYGNDTSLILSPTPWIYASEPSDRSYTNLQLFTDRKIYRPGQTVYFKGIVYESNKNELKTIPNKTCTITLRDANYKEVLTQTVTTNSFGSFAGEFLLPQGLLNGQFTILSDINYSNISIQVEEYKRPTFDIRFTENDSTYRLGDQVTVEGNAKSFSGVNVSNSALSYRVTRQPHWLYRWGWSNPVQVAEGVVQTEDDGSFKITFAAERAFEDKDRKDVFYVYTIEASITDTKGETQQSQTNVNIGDIPAYLDVKIPSDVIDKETFSSITINALNLNGRLIQAKGTYEIFKLKPKDANQLDASSEEWISDKKIAGGDFEAGKEISLATIKSLVSGRYRLIARAEDTKEKQVDFSIASMNDKQPPVPVYQWLIAPKTECAIGENVDIVYGSSAKNVYVLYEIFKQDGKRASVYRFILNNENKKLTIPYLEDYGDGFTVYFTFIKDSQIFTKQVAIYKKQPDKNLSLKMEVFRDRLLPGQSEEWKISVKDADKNPVLAELMTVMYDASLDKILNHSWAFNPIPRIYLQTTYFNNGKEFDRTYSSFEGKANDYQSISDFSFDQFNWFGWSIYYSTLYGAVPMMRSASALSVKGTQNEGIVAEVADVDMREDESAISKAAVPIETNSGEADNIQPEVQVRQNFNETAFFYPQLKTNEAGETLISFTVPESNTTWKLMGLAHTTDLKFGQIIENIISQKQLMVRPNLPRFLREGDQVTIASDISNLSKTIIDGTVQMECFDPATNQTNITIPESSQSFHLEAEKTTTVSWTFQVPSGIDLTALKIVARSSEFSDGEQHLIPILPNRMLVTESLPLNIQGDQTKTFVFDGMKTTSSPTKENYRLTLEFTSNPIWYAVQALPALTTPESDNVLSWFATYYSNALAVYLANSTPKIKSIIDAWTKQGGTKETLLSQLEKNQELKAVLLEETPWVMESQDETEQKQRLALLFDMNRANYLNNQAIEKLQSLQTDEGGWAWFKGMPANVSITQWLLYGMGELSRLNAVKPTDEIEKMQAKAVRFIDEYFKLHYEYYKKNNLDGKMPETISTYELEYLFVRSMYKNIPLDETKEAFQFYLELAEKYWTKNTRLYDRAIAAMVLQRNGKTQTALSIIKSLREHATHTPDEGMFWANNQAQSFLFQSATCIHTFMMQAFQETGSLPGEMDEMKLWLLKQKQTQQWESSPATVNAVNILLQTGSKWLESDGNVSIKIGSQTLDTENGEAGTGYIKTAFDSKSILPDMDRITITKKGAGPGWGAVYGQYFENLDKIQAAKTGLNVEKSLFIEKVTATGKSLLPLAENQSLKIGDKVIVRLVVRADRDLEYVLLKDLRASCFEPAETLSGIRWAQQVIYYQMTRDASTNFYFYNLPKGTYVFEYPLYANAAGDYSNGTATIQCLYAPEYVSHTSGGRVKVE